MKFKNREEIKKILEMDISDKEKRNLIANLKNHKTCVGRVIAVDYELDIEEGQIWDNGNKATSWTDRNDKNNVQGFKTEGGGEIEYILKVEDELEGYKVQYFNYDDLEEEGLSEDEIDELLDDEVYEELMYLLGSDGDMKYEVEMLIPAETQLEIVEINDGREDVGYIEVILREAK